MIKAILFDMGGVLSLGKVEYAYEELARRLGIDVRDIMELYSKIKIPIQTGELKPEEFTLMLVEKFKINAPSDEIIYLWKDCYNKMLPVNNEMIEFTKELHKKYRLVALSNNPRPLADRDKERGVFLHFDKVIWSCDIGFLKPQKEVFLEALKFLELKPQECVYIDDREELTLTPKDMGFNVVLFEDISQLKKILNGLGI